ncbi:MAG: hypothetical protein JNL79_03065 [Myxococcales bacterium]|nr:hypothetical protein [Myxococcales bacterium]
MRRTIGILVGVLGAGALFVGCGADASADRAPGDFRSDAGSATDTGTFYDTGTPPPVDTGPPPEKEVESSYRSPVATGRTVWIANPKSGRVAFVDATTLDAKVVEAGNGPTFMAAVPGGDDVALVLNVLSDDATMFRRTDVGMDVKTFKTHHAANAWGVSRDGRWAIAWTDVKAVTTPYGKIVGFQDLTVIDLSAKGGPPIILAVGYRPVSVGFTKDGKRAFAVTQDGVSIIDLFAPGGPLVVKNVPISDDPLADPGTRDVSVTPDGAYALIRRDGDAAVTIVSLETEVRTKVTLSGPVTDLDLVEDGSKAIAVVREKAEVFVLPIPGVATKPTEFTSVTITGETVGSVSIAGGGASAVLYTNAVAAERFTVLRLDTTPLSYRVQKLYAPVLGVFPTGDAQAAVVLHDKTAPKAGAFSLVPISTGLPAKIVGTDAPLTAVALAKAGDRAILTERDDGKAIYGAYLARFPSLSVDRFPLASPPIAAGVVEGSRRAWIAQQHTEGRITFIDLEKGEARTLTGFELSARVVDGSKP